LRTEFENKTVAVVGLARSGIACCKVLTKLGAFVIPYDGKPAAEIPDGIASAVALGLTPIVGGAELDYGQLDYVVTSPGVRKNAPVLQNAVAVGVPVLGEIEAAYRITQAPILAITGTNGKTTTTALLGEMLKAAGIETYIAGNIAAGDIAMPLIEATYLATPEAAIVAEISSFQLEWISTFRPKVAALLNITPDHGDRQNWEEYVAAKWRIFENLGDGDTAVYYYNLPASVHVNNRADLVPFGELPLEKISEICAPSNIRLPGEHNVDNILAAAAMAKATGVGMEPIRQVAATFAGVVHRLEYVDTLDGVRYVNNSMCTNVAAFEKSLEALPEPKIVIAGGVFKGDDVMELGRAIVKNNVRALVLIGRSAPEIEASARAAGYEKISLAGTLREAVSQARGLAHIGDTVLLAPACASFDMFHNFEDRGDQFKAAVRAIA